MSDRRAFSARFKRSGVLSILCVAAMVGALSTPTAANASATAPPTAKPTVTASATPAPTTSPTATHTAKPDDSSSSVSDVSLSLSSSVAGNVGVTYTLEFTTGPDGALPAGSGQITVAAPSGTGFEVQNDSGVVGVIIADVYDETAGQDLGSCGGGVISDGGSKVTWTLGVTIPAGHEVELTIPKVTNPAAGTYQLGVSTSGDGAQALTPAYTLTAPQSVNDPSIQSVSTTAAGATGVTYKVQFTTSSTGALTTGGGTITLAAPTGTGFLPQNDSGVEGVVIADVYDVTAGQDLGDSRGGATSDGGSTVTWTVEPTIPAGHVIDLTIPVVTNPSTPGSYQWTISTSADAQAVQTPAFTIVPAQQLSDVSFYPDSSFAGDSDVRYFLNFQTSSTGGLLPGAGTITLAAPAGTVFPVQNDNGVEGVVITDIVDVTTGVDLGSSRGGTTSDGGSTVTWTLEPGLTAGDQFEATIDGVTNPAAGTYQAGVSTSSDPAVVQSSQFTIYPVHGSTPTAVSQVTVSTGTTPAAGATTDYTVTFVTSADGGLYGGTGVVDIQLPAGSSAEEGTVYDGTDPVSIEGCGGSNSQTVSCDIGSDVNPGDTLTVDVFVTNPSAGDQTLTVSTSADTVAVTSPDYTITPEQGVSDVTAPKVTTSAGGTTTTYSVSLTTSSTGALSADAGSAVYLNLPQGTTYTGAGDLTEGAESVGTCEGSSTDVECDLYTDVAAGATLTATFNATDPSPGTYSLGLSTSSDTIVVTSPSYSIGLSVKLTATPAEGVAPLETSLIVAPDDPDGATVTYSLAFGDGSAVTGTMTAPYTPISISHTYVGAGVYAPAVSVTDAVGQAAKASASVTSIGVVYPTANAGDSQSVVVGTAVTLDGSRSQPANSITSYQWSFGDGSTGSGATVQHTYNQTGTYIAVLTITDGALVASAQATITVIPQPTVGLAVTVTGSSGPLAGASIAVIAPSGTRYSATTNAQGVGTIAGLPDGSYTADVYADGFLPASVPATQTGGAGTASVTLQPGSISQTSVTSTPLTATQIAAAGLDPNNPANQNVYQFSVDLNLTGTSNSAVAVSGDLTGCGLWDASVSGADEDDPSGGCSGSLSFSEDGYDVVAEPETEQSQPVIAWMIIPDSAQWTKQFFNVSVLISNLAPTGFSFDAGTVTLAALPAGLSLAPLATPQTLAEPMPSIPSGGSQSVSWVLRGDAEGFYGINASYQGTLDPGAFPLTIPITSAANAIHVWGASAVQMTIDADATATAGSPFLVRVGLTNVADVPVYNAQVQLSAQGDVGYIYQPLQQLTYQTAAIAPGQTFWTDYYRLVPTVSGTLDLSKSFVSQVSGTGGLQTTFVSHPAAEAPTMTATTQSGGVELDFTPPQAVATEYEVFFTPSATTAFGTTPIATVPLGASSTVIANGQSGYYALSAVAPDGSLAMYNELAGTEGTGSQQAPSFSADTPPTTATVGLVYSYTFIATGTPAGMTYSLNGAPAWLTINPGTGTVTGTPPSPAANFTYSVTASNGVSPNATTPEFAVTVSAAPTFTTATPPTTGTTGQVYSYTFVATGTPSAITYSLVNAPTWLTIGAQNGVVTGTPPAKTKTFSYAVKASNGVNPAATTAVFKVTVAQGPTAPQFTADSPPTSVVVGAKYAYTFTATGTPSTITYSLVGAPSWLTIKATTGAVSGKVPAGANFSFVVTASNGVNPDATTPTFQINETPAATTTKLSAPALTYGGEETGKFTTTVSASGATPTGSVTVMDGPLIICSAVLASGRGTCTMPSAVQMNVGDYEYTAVYTSNSGSFTNSVSLITTGTIKPATSKTALKLTSTVTYGAETTADFTATATATGVYPPGTVAVLDGTVTLCSATLGSGTATCTLNVAQLAVGRYTLTAVYTSATDDVTGSTSSAVSLTVVAAKSTTTLSFTTPVTVGAEQAAAFQVAVTAPGTTPTGSVAIEQGSTVLCTATLSGGIGTCTLTASQLNAGTYSLKAIYTPAGANVAGSTSATVSLVVQP